MPIYAYRCAGCQHQFELRQSFNDDPIATCPECRAAVHRVIQPVGVVFKGGGWYSTDRRRASSPTLNGSKEQAEDGSAASSSSSESEEPASPSPSPTSDSSSSSASSDMAPSL